MQTPRFKTCHDGQRALHQLGVCGAQAQIRRQQGGEAGGQANFLHLAYPVPLNRAYRNFRGITVLSPEGKAWKHAAGLIAQASGLRPLDGPVCCRMILHPKTTKSGEASKVRMDLDAIFKLCLDALNGIAWHDDKQIIELSARVGEPAPEGGLTVEIDRA